MLDRAAGGAVGLDEDGALGATRECLQPHGARAGEEVEHEAPSTGPIRLKAASRTRSPVGRVSTPFGAWMVWPLRLPATIRTQLPRLLRASGRAARRPHGREVDPYGGQALAPVHLRADLGMLLQPPRRSRPRRASRSCAVVPERGEDLPADAERRRPWWSCSTASGRASASSGLARQSRTAIASTSTSSPGRARAWTPTYVLAGLCSPKAAARGVHERLEQLRAVIDDEDRDLEDALHRAADRLDSRRQVAEGLLGLRK